MGESLGSVLRICLYGKESLLRNMDFKVIGSLKMSLELLVVVSGRLFGDSAPASKKILNSSKGAFTVKSCYWRRNAGQLQIRNWPWKLI
ncbi:hypothetical protein H5410_052083 [Solanum commersonii]|uniref:Uncharacterized protein n=1 Tax=Solanum commersonii TaxID=4109 RepID=A0A9J5X300_SOLCO|nr:hypothetical protein H5410_052083 [Solanum commersonii]